AASRSHDSLTQLPALAAGVLKLSQVIASSPSDFAASALAEQVTIPSLVSLAVSRLTTVANKSSLVWRWPVPRRWELRVRMQLGYWERGVIASRPTSSTRAVPLRWHSSAKCIKFSHEV